MGSAYLRALYEHVLHLLQRSGLTKTLIDQKPRYLNQNHQKLKLQDLAAIVMDEIELRLAARTTVAASTRRGAELEQELKEAKKQA